MEKSLSEIEFETLHDVWIDVRYKGPLLTPDGHENKYAVFRRSKITGFTNWFDGRLANNPHYYRKPTGKEVKTLAKIEYQRLLSKHLVPTQELITPEKLPTSDQGEAVEMQKSLEAKKRGGRAPKKNAVILEAAKKFIVENRKRIGESAVTIATSFQRKYKSAQPYEVTVDSINYEVYCDGKKVYSSCARGSKGKHHDKSIAYSTFLARYISEAKRAVEPSNSNISL